MQNDIFRIILIYEDNLRFYQVFVLNRQIITDWTQMTHMFSGRSNWGFGSIRYMYMNEFEWI